MSIEPLLKKCRYGALFIACCFVSQVSLAQEEPVPIEWSVITSESGVDVYVGIDEQCARLHGLEHG